MAESEKLTEAYRFEVDGRKFVYDVDRMMIFEVDEAISKYYEIAMSGQIESPHDQLAQIYGADVAETVLEDLRKTGLLVSAVVNAPVPEKPTPQRGFSGVTLNVTHGCNLRCTYCFAKQGDYGLGNSLMTEETARKAVDWLSERRNDKGSTRVGFFGGEPLMNMRVISGTVEYANERLGSGREVLYHITTNGTLLTEKTVKVLADTKNLEVQVSLDGVPEVNDQFRIFANGKGSHDIIAKGIERLKSATGKVTLRGTIPPGAPDFSKSLVHFIDDLGATTAAFEPMTGATTCGKTLDAHDIDAIKREWEKVADYFVENIERGDVKPISQLLHILMRIYRRKKTVYGCTAGWSNVAVDPKGDIYPCHRFVGESDWKMGNIHEETLDDSICEKFAENTVDNREPCRSCWVRYTCGGSCAHEAKQTTGGIARPDPVRCDLMRNMTLLALKVYVRTEPYHHQLLDKYAATYAR